MREIILAKHAGFCFGVERAVKEVYRLIDEHGETSPIYTYGSLIHNEQVVADLEARGVRRIEAGALSALPAGEGIAVIRCHGIARAEEEALAAKGLVLADTTCPFVRRIHEVAAAAGEEGRTVIVIGDAEHPEVRGIVGRCTGPVHVLRDEQDAARLDLAPDTALTVVFQTTLERNKIKKIVEILEKRYYNTRVTNTICSATSVRQEEAAQIASVVDAMIVIGGAHSSNTQKLVDVCKRLCQRTYPVQKAGDLEGKLSGNIRRVGITAGASTPGTIIEEVVEYVRTGSDV